MMVVRRRLFWKVYLTLLSSLIAVAVLVGTVLWLVGGTPRERWDALRATLADRIVPLGNAQPAVMAAAVQRLSEEMDADISIYAADGRLIASWGEPIVPRRPDLRLGPHRVISFGLPAGRSILARLDGPQPPGFRVLMVVLVVVGGVALAAFPVTARLTRRLERLRAGVERWGSGALATRVEETGEDEVGVVARTFNAAAGRVETLVTSQKALLANASHELRSPLARLRMANELWVDRPTEAIRAEIARNLDEIDQLVGEILLASRLDHPASPADVSEPIDLLGLAAEEAARVDAVLVGTPVEIDGDATLLRRLIRNLLDNAVKHGRPPIEVSLASRGGGARLVVSDKGQGIAPPMRERVFEPFFRPAGHGEASGGWGLGLSLVRQIAARHGGTVTCEAETGGGSRFVVDFPGG